MKSAAYNTKKEGQWGVGLLNSRNEGRNQMQDKTSCTITHTDAESLAYVVLFKKILWMMKVCYNLYLQSATKGL